MKWRKYSDDNSNESLSALVQKLQSLECCISYSPLPDNPAVTITILPSWEVAARRKSSAKGSFDIAEFSGVKRIKISIPDTLMIGVFSRGECVLASDRLWRFTLKDVPGYLCDIEFSFSQYELNIHRYNKMK